MSTFAPSSRNWRSCGKSWPDAAKLLRIVETMDPKSVTLISVAKLRALLEELRDLRKTVRSAKAREVGKQ